MTHAELIYALEPGLANTDLIATARAADGTLLGVARALAGYARACYLADLAVDRAHAGRGIGRALIAFVHAAAGAGTLLNLIAAAGTPTLYDRIGLARRRAAFTVPRGT